MIFWIVSHVRNNSLKLFWGYFGKVGTPDGPKLTEMVTYRHFMLHQSIILSKMRKLGLIIHPAGFFRLYFMTNMVVLRLFLAYLAKFRTPEF